MPVSGTKLKPTEKTKMLNLVYFAAVLLMLVLMPTAVLILSPTRTGVTIAALSGATGVCLLGWFLRDRSG